MDRFHNFELIIYYSSNFIDSIINNDKNISHFAYIYHDKDIADNGSLKVPHYHLLVNFKNAKTFNSCLSEFTLPSYNTFVMPINEKNKLERYEYLTHTNNPEKFQYSNSLIITNNSNFWLNCNSSNNEKIVNLIDDIICKKSLKYMLETYGRDYVINYDKFHRFANELRYESEGLSSYERQKKQLEVIADSRSGEVKACEDTNIQTDFLLDVFPKNKD